MRCNEDRCDDGHDDQHCNALRRVWWRMAMMIMMVHPNGPNSNVSLMGEFCTFQFQQYLYVTTFSLSPMQSCHNQYSGILNSLIR